MEYHRHYPACNGDLSLNSLDTRHRRQPSMASRMFAYRFNMTPATAAVVAFLAGFPAAMEE